MIHLGVELKNTEIEKALSQQVFVWEFAREFVLKFEWKFECEFEWVFFGNSKRVLSGNGRFD
jgi:hypothetical protein